MTDPRLTLIGDGIEDPANARVMLDIARMLGAGCSFRDRKHLAPARAETNGAVLPLIALDEVAAGYRPVIACETLADAVDIYGYRLPVNTRAALLVATSASAWRRTRWR